MKKDQKIIKKIRELKAGALRRRMVELELTDSDVAVRCKLPARGTLSKWKSGDSWPKPAGETLLEKALEVHEGFFGAISEGFRYEDTVTLFSFESISQQGDIPTLSFVNTLASYLSILNQKTDSPFLRESLGRLMMAIGELQKALQKRDSGQNEPPQIPPANVDTAEDCIDGIEKMVKEFKKMHQAEKSQKDKDVENEP